MNYTDRLTNVSVLGAGGKMGSGILLLTAMEIADLKLQPENRDKHFVVNAIDVSSPALEAVMDFLRAQVQKAAEKKINFLREVYADRDDLVENRDMIQQYIFDVLKIIRCSTRLESSYDSKLIFEAIIENPEVKVGVLTQIDRNNKNQPWFFTNTSSIPIHELDENANLNGRIIGFHFYNPPAVQKLVELIPSRYTLSELTEFSKEYAKRLKKVVVPSNDIAGFIGNGHFMRDALHGISEAERLAQEMSFPEAVYMINKVSQEFLIRPMGIFQLIDYVGLDVCQYIMSVMDARLKNQNLHSDLLDKLVSQGIKGGQYADGSQKDGILKYEKGKPVAVFDPDKKDYVSIGEFQAKCDEKLGPLPENVLPWKAAVGHKDKENFLKQYFKKLNEMDTFGAELARRYGKRSKEIALQLVKDGVAKSEEDVNTVLLTGFYHVYGPINEYF